MERTPACAAYRAGERLVYEKLGVCRVAETTPREIAGMTGLYYTLVPDNNAELRIYVPVNNKKLRLRAVVSPETARQLIALIPAVRACPADTQDVAAYLAAKAKTPLPAESAALLEQLAYAYGKRSLVQQMKKKRGLFELRTPKEVRESILNEFSIALALPPQELERLALGQTES